MLCHLSRQDNPVIQPKVFSQKMSSITFIVLFLCLFAIIIEAGDWSVSGSLGYDSGGGWSGSVGLSYSWRRKRRSTTERVFNVIMFMENQKTGSRFRLNPCDFALYDQDGDMAVTLRDFDAIFNNATEHKMVEQLFHELDVDDDQKISIEEFEEKHGSVFSKKTCVAGV